MRKKKDTHSCVNLKIRLYPCVVWFTYIFSLYFQCSLKNQSNFNSGNGNTGKILPSLVRKKRRRKYENNFIFQVFEFFNNVLSFLSHIPFLWWMVPRLSCVSFYNILLLNRTTKKTKMWTKILGKQKNWQ